MVESDKTLGTLLRERGLTPDTLAHLLGLNRATTYRWLQRRVPADRVVAVERVTGIRREHLRPDLYRNGE
jgi:DNA-binding transcriptional regulator YdaS (Cro superfamily)